jgi:cytochrome c oxidase subunit II
VIDLAQNYRFGLPVAASTYAERLDFSLNLLHGVMLVIFVLWAVFFAYCLVRFRRRPGAPAHAPIKGAAASFLPDAVILGFEIWLIFFFGMPIWSHIKEKFPEESGALVVDLVAEQFSWGFQYPGPDGKFGKRDFKRMGFGNLLGLDEEDADAADDVVMRNVLHVPLGKPTILRMTSKDVIHSFFVPEFRTKHDIVPGMQTRVWFEPNRTGVFEIVCSQLCGTGHYVMRGEVVVHSPEDFAAWEQARQAEKAASAPAAPAEDWAE